MTFGDLKYGDLFIHEGDLDKFRAKLRIDPDRGKDGVEVFLKVPHEPSYFELVAVKLGA